MAPALLRALSRLGARPRRAEAADDRPHAPTARSSVHIMQTGPVDPASYPRRLLHQFLGHRAAVSQPALRSTPGGLLQPDGGPDQPPQPRRASSAILPGPQKSSEPLALSPARLQTPHAPPALDASDLPPLDTARPATPDMVETPPSTASAQSSGTYTDAASAVLAAATTECSPQSARTLDEGTKRHADTGAAGMAKAAAEVSEAEVSERCAAHPGSRNEMWCETCAAAICEHCVASAGHQGHRAAKLSAAYDDAFEAVEAMQVGIVRSMTEARQRGTLLDAAQAELAASCVAAQDALETQLGRAADALEKSFGQTRDALGARANGCAEWRGALEETLQTVQRLAEELPPAQLVASRARILALLDASEKARPADWWAPLPRVDGLAALVQPECRYASLRVPRVMELGRKRGHVRVAARPLAAHGLTWHAEARRTRGPLGDPCLLVAVTCAEGCQGAAIAASVHVLLAGAAGRAAGSALDLLRPASDAGEPDPWQQQQEWLFRHESRTHVWAKQAACEFLVCSLAELESAGAVDSDGAVTVRFGVQPESFRELARAQQDRIAALERQVEELRLRPRSPGSPTAPRGRRRGNSDVRSWGSSPRSQQRAAAGLARARPLAAAHAQSPGLPQMPPFPPPPSLEFPPPPGAAAAGPGRGRSNSTASPLPPPPHSPAGDGRSPGSPWMRKHRRALSLTSKLRRQPPIPFPLGAGRANSVQLPPLAAGSAASTSSSQALSTAHSHSGVLRRLSGWMRSTEDRVVQQARRVRQQLAPPLPSPPAPAGSTAGTGPGCRPSTDDICDWTFLDRSFSPGFAANGLSLAARPSPAHQLGPQEDGFGFDGLADIECEQARVDARTEQSSEQRSEAGLRARCDSIRRRFDALELITNTVENSRDGLTESTLRRISSELTVLRDGRMRRIAEARAQMMAAHSPTRPRADTFGLCFDPGRSPTAEARRSISMDPAEINCAVARAAIRSESPPVPPPVPASFRRTSEASASSMSSLSSLPMGSLAAVHAAGKAGPAEQLTPQASRRGGILKAGRTVRAAPSRNSGRLGEAPLLADGVCGTSELLLMSVESARGLGDALMSSRESVRRRQRTAKPARKRVRFPEEQRLLETIRLIDPRTAESIESRAEKTALPSVSELEPEPASEPQPEPELSPPCSPDLFGTASSRLVDDVPGPKRAAARFARPPLPSLCAGALDVEEQRMVRCKGAMIFNRAVLSPTLAAMAHGCTRHPAALAASADESSEESDGAASAVYEDAVSDPRELADLSVPRGLAVLVARPGRPRAASALAVGPNVASAQSSPVLTQHAQGPASSYSSSPSPPARPPETAVFHGLR